MDGGLAASSVTNMYQPSQNTITHNYAGKGSAKVKKKDGKMKNSKSKDKK